VLFFIIATTNIYNSGIAILTVGSLLYGILEIAGISSVYIKYYSIVGWIAIGLGITALFIIKFKKRGLYIDKK
jgi:hypothetical protein